ncbi:MAG: GAF domain-containing protein [Chloroflexi bacterium]|nr:GAF domain-containing protein [Chloroflexota bacterium]
MINQPQRFSLRIKMILAFALVSLVVSGVASLGFYRTLQRQNLEGFRRRVLNAISIIELNQNGDEFTMVDSAQNPLYDKIRLQNTRIRDTDPDFIYLYTMRRDAQGIFFVVDAGDPLDEGFSAYAERYLEPSPFLVENWDSLPERDPIVEPAVYTDEYGSFISAYAPIKTSDGKYVGVVGLDISADTIVAEQNLLLVQSLSIMLLAVCLGISIGYFTGGILNRPLKELTDTTTRVSSGDLTARAMLKTGDEVEQLGDSLNRMAERIQAEVATLEERVSNRTIELEIANRYNERRSRQFQTITQVAREISNIQELETLLPSIAKLISEQFGHYHTGIFMLDEKKEYAVLSAANSEGGLRMLARGHQLRIGQTGIVGYVAATGNPRIVLDVGLDSVYFDNPDLPNTHSELALPLRIAGQVIGVLDVQSELENAFREDDAEVLSTLADQVAIAIQNTRTLDEARKSLIEVQSAYGASVMEAWKVLRPQSIGTGMQWKDSSLTRLNEPIQDHILQRAIETGETVVSKDQDAVLAIPIRLRERIIGVMRLKNNLENRWTEDEVDIAQAIANRLSLAIETASLITTSQQRAEIERVTSDITAKIGASSRFETILQSAAQELSKALGGSDVLVQIEPAALKLGRDDR